MSNIMSITYTLYYVYHLPHYAISPYLRPVVEARSEPGGTRWRTGGEVKGKLAIGVGSQYSHATSERGLSSITQADAHTSAVSSRLNWRPHPFKWTRPFGGKTKYGFCACAIRFRTSYTRTKSPCTSSLPHMFHMPHPTHSFWIGQPDNIVKAKMHWNMCYWKTFRHFFETRGFTAWNEIVHWSWLLNKQGSGLFWATILVSLSTNGSKL